MNIPRPEYPNPQFERKNWVNLNGTWEFEIDKSASGKDTIQKWIVTNFPELTKGIVSCTTRPPREGEQDGVAYHFLSDEEFAKKMQEKEIGISVHFIPLFNFSKTAKTIIFVVAIVLAYLIYNIIHPKKIGWMMSVVDYNNRGDFTAKKEMTSLIFGMIFSYSMFLDQLILIDSILIGQLIQVYDII